MLTIQEKLNTLSSNRNQTTQELLFGISTNRYKPFDSATGDISRTTNGWVEDVKYGIYAAQTATAWSVSFDSTVTRTGKLTLKASTTNTTGRVSAILGYDGGTGASLLVPGLSSYGIKLKPSTNYSLSCYVKTNNIVSQSSFTLHEYGATGTRNAANASSPSLSGTNDWTLITKTFTTNASTVFGVIAFNNAIAGNVSDIWFDVNSMTLEEVGGVLPSTQESANVWAGTSRLSIQEAINVKAGTTGLSIQDALNTL